MSKVTLKIGDHLCALKCTIKNPQYVISEFKNGKPLDSRGFIFDMDYDFYYVNGVKYDREDIIIPGDSQEPKILSPSQPNMRVGGWVKCIRPFIGVFDNKNYGFNKNKWYPISHIKKRDYPNSHQYSLEFAVHNLLDENVLAGESNSCVFTSDHFDCDNVMPFNPDGLKHKFKTFKEGESRTEIVRTGQGEWFGHIDKNEHTNQSADMINNPPHYTFGGIECIDAIKAQLGTDGYIAFLRGQIAKYNWRLMHKNNPIEDAKKLQDYANKLVEELEGNDENKN